MREYVTLEQVAECTRQMVEDGILYVAGYDEFGEELYQLTEKGRAIAECESVTPS